MNPADAVRPRGSAWLVGLLLTTFVIGTDDFIIAGILPAISADLNVSEAAAGQLVTVFSITYAVAAPIMAVATARLPRKMLIVGGLTVFAVINFATAFVTAYSLLMVLRVLAALVAATVSPAAFGVAGALAAPERIGRAIGTVAAGLTVSLVVGVPLGSWIGSLFDWQETFVTVGGLTTIAVLVTALALPHIPPAPAVSVRDRLVLLKRPPVLLGVIGTVIGACAGLMTYTYIAPVTHDLTGTGAAHVPVFIVIMGVAGALGTYLGGRLTDQWGVDRTLMASFTGVLVATLGLAAVGQFTGGDAPVWLVGVFLVLWGVSAWGNNPPMTSRALQLAGAAGTEAIALNTSGLYVGVALAGAIGGGALTAGGGSGVLLVGAAVGLVTIVVMAIAVRRYPIRPVPAADQQQVPAAS
jgi:predicted MFS family arabinose efflux permease